MINITEKQKRALELIYNAINTSGYPPSFADLREELGVSSNQSVLNFLKSLERKGFIKREEGQARGIKILPLGFKILNKEILVPFAGHSAAGAFIESPTETFAKWETISSEIYGNEIIKQSSEEVFIIQVHGDSMINAGISDGDMLLVKKSKEYKSGDIVVARNDDGTTVKKFIADANGRVYLKPENPAHKIIPIFPETIFDGKVILNLSALNKK